MSLNYSSNIMQDMTQQPFPHLTYIRTFTTAIRHVNMSLPAPLSNETKSISWMTLYVIRYKTLLFYITSNYTDTPQIKKKKTIFPCR